MKSISIDDLPKWGPWPQRIMGLETFDTVRRDLDKITDEYDQDKWAACLERFHGGLTDPVELRFSVDGPGDTVRPRVVDGMLVTARRDEMTCRLVELLTSAIASDVEASKTVVELGCGFGANLAILHDNWPDSRYLGGEYADSGIALAGELFAGIPSIEVSKVNFYDDRYPQLEEADAPITVFTSQALEQLPQTAPFLDALGRYRDRVHAVWHLEPCYDLHDPNTLMGLMRRRYLELNDYNRDLISELRGRPEIEITEIQADAIGFNPYNALSLVRWRFRDGPAARNAAR